MLVLSRQISETIMIGDDIQVTVVDIRGDKIRLGISAPENVAVHRREVYHAIRRERADAAATSPAASIPLCAQCGRAFGEYQGRALRDGKAYHLGCAPAGKGSVHLPPAAGGAR